MRNSTIPLLFLFLLNHFLVHLNAQVLTKEDSLTAGLIAASQTTVLSGYGSMHYSKDLTSHESEANIERIVMFFGHKFSKKIFFFSEMEIEDAKIDGSDASGEFSLEQALLKFQLSKRTYLTTGLFTPRIGIINENHLPNTYNGIERPFVEQFIIPSTWRELGISIYGNSKRILGLNYSLSIINGLNSANFENGSGIREGRYEGRNATTGALALTGSLLQYWGPFRIQASVYYGGSAGLIPSQADSLQLNSGAFGTPIALAETNFQFHQGNWSAKFLGTIIQIPEASRINMAYASNTPLQLFGLYGELAYACWKKELQKLNVFGRFETLNMNRKIPVNGILNPTLEQKYCIIGLNYFPIQGVVIKLDYTIRLTGEQNPILNSNPFYSQPFFTQHQILNIGLGYSF